MKTIEGNGESAGRGLWVRTTVATLLAFILWTQPSEAQGVPVPNPLYVNAETGDDSDTGSSTDPLQSLNRALQIAADTTGPTWKMVDTIIVQASAVPIAPKDFGVAPPDPNPTEGHEEYGWTWPNEGPRKPFPIRMQSGVSVIGVADAEGNRPKIMLDEQGESLPYTDWMVIPSKTAEPGTVDDYWCVVAGEKNSSIQGFDIDGTGLIDESVSWWPAIYATDVTNFHVLDCDIHSWHDACRFAAKVGVGTRVHVTECILRDSFPRESLDDGHAGIWVEGNGGLGLTLSGTTISNCHDGIEVDTRATGTATVTIISTSKVARFDRTENVLEVVNMGPVTVTIDGAVFVNNHNRPSEGGVPLPPAGTSTGAVICRAETTVHSTIRNSQFWNCGLGIVTGTSASSTTNLGTDASHGNNSFCLDYSDDYMAMDNGDPIRAMLWTRHPGTITAAGNWWIADSQGASGSGHLTGPVTATSENNPPPGPGAGPVDSGTGLPWRNYSIAVPPGADPATIQFGALPPSGDGPDCTQKP